MNFACRPKGRLQAKDFMSSCLDVVIFEGSHFALKCYGNQNVFVDRLELTHQGDLTWNANR